MLFPNHTLTLIMCLHLTWCCKNVQFSQTPLLLVRIISMGWDHDIFMVSVIKDSQLIMYSAIMKKIFVPNIMYCTPCSRGRRSYMSIFNRNFFKFHTNMKLVYKYFLNYTNQCKIHFEYIQDLNSIQKHWRELAFYAIVMNEFINIQTHLNFNYVVIRKCQKWY